MDTFYHIHQKIDHYEILSRLPDSQGCQRYLAQDWLQYRQVLLQFPARYPVRGKAIEEGLEREAALSTSLTSSLFPHALNPREQRQGRYLVLEYLPGQTLRHVQHLAGAEGLQVSEVLRITIAVCEALTVLHAQGIVHRDLKPEHILVLETGAVKLTGLGLAQKLFTVRRDFRQVGFPVGTPDYLAPELWWGHPGSVQSDLYAVGVLLYELLAWHPPFGQTTHYRLLLPQLAYDPPDLLQVCPTADPRLATVVMRAIRRDPARRYASSEALRADLVSLEQVTPVVYQPDPRAWGGQYRLVLVLFLLTLVIVAWLVAIGLLAQLIHAVG
jgi:eukaryotic-like serine/threonine-protein kinase